MAASRNLLFVSALENNETCDNAFRHFVTIKTIAMSPEILELVAGCLVPLQKWTHDSFRGAQLGNWSSGSND